ncbi:MAG: hypothetical protein IT181_00925, partial [Acidobacteria bacterium]|nr:hypothetical protein [Acidobacteriota bacterium]
SAPLHGMHAALLARTRELIAGCDCDRGCPTCVGPIGETGPRAKTVALAILQTVLTGELPTARTNEAARFGKDPELSAGASAEADAPF